MEQYWSRFSADFSARETYVVGETLIGEMKKKLEEQHSLGRLVEFGCGSGTFTQSVVSRAESVLATDYSTQMVEETRRRFEKNLCVRVEQADCRTTNYAETSFDTVLMANLIHVISNPESALQESYRILRDRGTLLITSISAEKMSLWQKLKLLYRYRKAFGSFPEGRTPFTVQSLAKAVSRAGFTVQEAVLIGETTRAVFIKAEKNTRTGVNGGHHGSRHALALSGG